MARAIRSTDQYKEKLMKIIPSEIIGAYVVIQGLLVSQDPVTIKIVIGILVLLTVVYLWRVEKVRDYDHIVFAAVSFLVWVYSIAPREILGEDIYNPELSSIVLVLCTLFIPLVVTPAKAEAAIADKKIENKT